VEDRKRWNETPGLGEARAASASAGEVQDFDELVAIVAALRGEPGCPWDRAQTEASLRPYLLEEVHEVLDAIDRADDDGLKKELGDLLFLVVLLSRIGEQRGAFDLSAVIAGICRKMVARHPHVFDPNHVNTADEGGLPAWEARKAKEKPGGSALDGVPSALPALLRAHRITEKASRVGFDWPDAVSVRRKVDEELHELDEAMVSGDADHIAEELGDVLFSLVNLGRFLPVGAEDALRLATGKFERRFRAIEAGLAADGLSVHDVGVDVLEARWQKVKEGGG
jgi:ATP diphosphatase